MGSPPLPTCAAKTCRRGVVPPRKFCQQDWNALAAETRHALIDAYGREGFLDLVAAAADELEHRKNPGPW